MNIDNLKYTKNYCEENIWHLCQSNDLIGLKKYILIISNEIRTCPFWYQKASDSIDKLIWWDYHVVLLVKKNHWMMYDFDTILDFPTKVDDYLSATFKFKSNFEDKYLPKYKVIEDSIYIFDFFSDRKHMLDKNGKWISEPPKWPIIENSKKLKLRELLDFTIASKQEIFSLDEIVAFYEK